VTEVAGRRVVAVTGGGGGIGAAVAEELGRQGAFVVTMDPLVTLDGSEVLPPPEETTAGRITAAGGSARATSVSVTDADAVRDLFAELGRIDAVVNVAGISRPTSFARGTEADWRDVLSVHLGGYVNVLKAALPMMAAAGHGRILGVTSGSGWRPADAGAYSCAKRAVAALTWQLGGSAPPRVTVNAISPIAVTRMVTAALGRAPASASAKGSSATGGLSLGSMPEPEELAPFAAHLVGEGSGWVNGQVLFAGGPEVALIERPRLLEVVRTDGVAALDAVLDAVGPGALAPAQAKQSTTGAGNPRFTEVFSAGAQAERSPSAVTTCALVSDRADLAAAVERALVDRGVSVHHVAPAAGFDGAATALATAGPMEAVVVVPSGRAAAPGGWEQLLEAHDGVVDGILSDAAWARAVADHSARVGAPVRLVTLTDATSGGGLSRAQAAAQLARAARGATEERVTAFAVSVEAAGAPDVTAAGQLAAHLVCHPAATNLSGAELVVGRGWLGLRSHPRPGPAITLGGSSIPDWFDDVLAEALGVWRFEL
jgi:NAD(P)-dependent dehydrogenase (short-subunit alcohol dehydrogenase family)